MASITGVQVRTADPDDMDRVVALGRRAWRSTFDPLVGADLATDGLCTAWSPTRISEEIRAGEVHVVSTQDGVVAMSSARDEGAQMFLARLYVDPAHQSTGVGHAALDAVLRAAGPRPTSLTVLLTNTRARRFYERHGFTARGIQAGANGWPPQLRMTHTPRHLTTTPQERAQ